MIQVNELRIGNWVKIGSLELIVENINDEGINGTWDADWCEHGYEDIDPIPLTPAVLEKAGALPMSQRFDGLTYAITVNNNVAIVYSMNGMIALATIVSEEAQHTQKTIVYYEHIKHLHQLQNLYHALTGTELIIK